MILSDFRVLLPKFRSSQQESIVWMQAAHEKSASGLSKIVPRYAAKPTRVGFRYHCLEDFCHENWNDMTIFNLEKNRNGAGAQKRTEFFQEVAKDAFRKFYAEEKNSPEEIIHVTCTGYVSPSAAQIVVSEKNWGQHVQVVHAYHMGCYAAIPAIKLAARVTKKIDIVHTELCSLHFDPLARDVEQIVVQGLFSDGLIRYSAFSHDEFKQTQSIGMEVLSLREEIISETLDEMKWKISDTNMEMILSRDIPKYLTGYVKGFLERLCAGIPIPEKKNILFAIHPGGPLIVDEMKDFLNLTKDQVRHSNQILYERGNMSSATLPHIWHEMLRDKSERNDQHIISLAFGPGLTVVGMVSKIVGNL